MSNDVVAENTSAFWQHFETHPWELLLFVIVMWTMWISYKRNVSVVEVWFDGFFQKKSCENCEKLEMELREYRLREKPTEDIKQGEK